MDKKNLKKIIIISILVFVLVIFVKNYVDEKIDNEKMKNVQEMQNVLNKYIDNKKDEENKAIEKYGIFLRDTTRMNHIKTIQTALELYYNDNDVYPIGKDLILGVDGQSALCNGGFKENINGCFNVYLGEVPKDPNLNRYIYSSDGLKYEINFSFEDGLDKYSYGNHIATYEGIK